MKGAGFLVWVTDFAGRPWPQWWADLFYGTDNQFKARVITSHAVAEADAGKPLADLAALYPWEGGRPASHAAETDALP